MLVSDACLHCGLVLGEDEKEANDGRRFKKSGSAGLKRGGVSAKVVTIWRAESAMYVFRTS